MRATQEQVDIVIYSLCTIVGIGNFTLKLLLGC